MRVARPSLDFVNAQGTLPILFAPVAQLDRASDYGSEGCVFESRRVHCSTSMTYALKKVSVWTPAWTLLGHFFDCLVQVEDLI
jgi:hypothetical protein